MTTEKSTIASDLNQKGAEFLKIELQTGMTFASIALSEERGSDKRIRNQANARKAYETVLRLRERLESPSEATRHSIEEGLERLRRALEKLDD